MAFLSRNDIEAIAARVTNGYRKLPRFGGQPVDHIDPEILTCDLCQLSLDHSRLSKNGTILGLTSYGKVAIDVYDLRGRKVPYYLDGRTILVEQSLKETPSQRGRYHFTVMHEAAHQILY